VFVDSASFIKREKNRSAAWSFSIKQVWSLYPAELVNFLVEPVKGHFVARVQVNQNAKTDGNAPTKHVD
jgi:hypothetical protein